MGRYIAGEKVIVEFTFAAGDPSDVEAWLRKPNGVEVELNVTDEAGEGEFSTEYTITTADPVGDYVVKVTGTGDVVGADNHVFTVLDDGFEP